MAELVERRVLVDRDTWSKIVYKSAIEGRGRKRSTRITAGKMLREASKQIKSKMGLW